MSTVIEETTKKIVGIAIKTNNEQAPESIPPMWGKFFSEGIASSIPAKVSDDVYAVYTGFENAGVNNDGEYTFLIGVEVLAPDDLDEHLDVVTIPAGNYHKFDVPGNSAE